MVICLATNDGSNAKLVTSFSLCLGKGSLKTVGMIGDGASDSELEEGLDGELVEEELDDELDDDDDPDELDEVASSIPPVRGCLPSSCAFRDSAKVFLLSLIHI